MSWETKKQIPWLSRNKTSCRPWVGRYAFQLVKLLLFTLCTAFLVLTAFQHMHTHASTPSLTSSFIHCLNHSSHMVCYGRIACLRLYSKIYDDCSCPQTDCCCFKTSLYNMCLTYTLCPKMLPILCSHNLLSPSHPAQGLCSCTNSKCVLTLHVAHNASRKLCKQCWKAANAEAFLCMFCE